MFFEGRLGFLPLGRYISYTLCTGRLVGDLMGTIGLLFPLTGSTDSAAVDQVQQQYLFISKLDLHWVNIYIINHYILLLIKMYSTYCCAHVTLIEIS